MLAKHLPEVYRIARRLAEPEVLSLILSGETNLLENDMALQRLAVPEHVIDVTLGVVAARIKEIQRRKGPFALISRHEILGAVTEEFHELVEAVRSDEDPRVTSELFDVAVAALFGIASIVTMDNQPADDFGKEPSQCPVCRGKGKHKEGAGDNYVMCGVCHGTGKEPA